MSQITTSTAATTTPKITANTNYKTSVTLWTPIYLINEIDAKRGSVSRSEFLLKLIDQGLKNSKVKNGKK